MEPIRFERFEYKYFVPADRCDDLRRFIAPYAVPDEHTASSGRRGYTITNLYFDSPGLDLYWNHRFQALDRFKLRLRAYGLQGEGALFFEVKRKIKQVILKNRVRVPRIDCEALLGGRRTPILSGPQGGNLEEFLGLYSLYGAGPSLLIRYDREAYTSVTGEYARLTFDRDIRYQPARGLRLKGEPNAWTYVDHSGSMGGQSGAALLELKFTRFVPPWMADLVSHFELQRHEFSKYLTAMTEHLEFAFEGRELLRSPAMEVRA